MLGHHEINCVITGCMGAEVTAIYSVSQASPSAFRMHVRRSGVVIEDERCRLLGGWPGGCGIIHDGGLLVYCAV